MLAQLGVALETGLAGMCPSGLADLPSTLLSGEAGKQEEDWVSCPPAGLTGPQSNPQDEDAGGRVWVEAGLPASGDHLKKC